MALEFNDREKRQKFLNELIKSPKQVKHVIARSSMNNCLQALPYCYLDGSVQEISFSHVSFCSDFSLMSVAGNKLLTIEDCVFHGEVNIHCLKDTKVIVRNCRFRNEPLIKTSGTVELHNINAKPAVSSPLYPDMSFSSAISLQDAIVLN